jgi:multiple sugar transport system ATP-binding protein
MARLELEGVGKRFADGTTAVQGASFRLEEGEFFILVGPSGCGKSTLLHVVAGLEEASSGEIRIDGRRVNELEPRERNVAMIFQSYAIYPHMSVRENLAFPLRLAKVGREEIRRRVEAAARTLGLEELLERRPAQLSGGQRQRVAMGRAIVREPALFLMDEPLSNLDARLRVQMRAEISQLHARLGTTTLYVTHDQTEAMTLGDRIAVMRRGAIEQIDSARALYAAPANLFVAGFIGSPAMNFAPADWDGERLALPMASLAPPPALCDALGRHRRRLVVGVRPEHLGEAESDPDRGPRLAFRARVARLEWTGAELHAHFEVAAPATRELERLARELEAPPPRSGAIGWVARLDPASSVREGGELALSCRAGRLHLFDPDTGLRLPGTGGLRP